MNALGWQIAGGLIGGMIGLTIVFVYAWIKYR